jgi:hypothetical protein
MGPAAFPEPAPDEGRGLDAFWDAKTAATTVTCEKPLQLC